MNDRYPIEELGEDYDDGTMPGNVAELAKAVIGRRIVTATVNESQHTILVLDDGTRVALIDSDDCCAYTSMEGFFLNPASVDHMILGVGTTDEYTSWHIYADFGDVMQLEVGWSCGNPFFYGYGFHIKVSRPLDEGMWPS